MDSQEVTGSLLRRVAAKHRVSFPTDHCPCHGTRWLVLDVSLRYAAKHTASGAEKVSRRVAYGGRILPEREREIERDRGREGGREKARDKEKKKQERERETRETERGNKVKVHYRVLVIIRKLIKPS